MEGACISVVRDSLEFRPIISRAHDPCFMNNNSGSEDPLLQGSQPVPSEFQDNLARALQVLGKVLLWSDLAWAIAWTVIAMIFSARTAPLPLVLVPGLPLAVYDPTAEYRNAHYGLALHGFLPSVYFSLAAGYSHEPLVAWYSLPIGFAVAVDLYANTQNWPHLSKDSIPEFFVMETVLATVALVLSTAVFIWYQAAYWHFRFTGVHFNNVGPRSAPRKDIEANGEEINVENGEVILPRPGTYRVHVGSNGSSIAKVKKRIVPTQTIRQMATHNE